MDLFDKILSLSRQGFYCAQIMLLLTLENEGRENPDLIRAMGGLNGGLGFTGDLCGCLTGGCCLLAYYLGMGEAEELADPEERQVIGAYVEWFKNKYGTEYGGCSCCRITGQDRLRQLEICPALMQEALEKCWELLEGRGLI